MNKHHHLTATITDRKGRVLSRATNSYTKTHPYQAGMARRAGLPDKIFLHAEIAAIVRCKRLDRAYKITVERYTADGMPANAAPCVICEEAIRQAGIVRVEFTC